MFYRSYTPGPPLGDFIGRFWLCSDTPPHPRERILPSGTIEMVFNLCDDEIRIYDPAHDDRSTRYSGAVVSGAYSSFFVIDPLVHASIIGVHFRPGGAFPFLDVPAGELADTHVNLADLWGPLASQLRDGSALPHPRSDSQCSKRRSSRASITRPNATTQYRLRSTPSSKPAVR